jgi:hypothetical protein
MTTELAKKQASEIWLQAESSTDVVDREGLISTSTFHFRYALCGTQKQWIALMR